MIPRYGEWDRRYRADGLTVLGVHAPETAQERDESALLRYTTTHGIHWKVILDPAFLAWDRYALTAWPSIVLIDRTGRIRSVFVGDSHQSEIETDLRTLLAEPI